MRGKSVGSVEHLNCGNKCSYRASNRNPQNSKLANPLGNNLLPLTWFTCPYMYCSQNILIHFFIQIRNKQLKKLNSTSWLFLAIYQFLLHCHAESYIRQNFRFTTKASARWRQVHLQERALPFPTLI